MITPEENLRLTQVGPGTPGGEMLRRYWWPVAFGDELRGDVPKVVELLGEEFVLFRDGRGQVGMLEPRCAHRGVKLAYGRVEDCGIRCCYHGWAYDVTGQCVDQPCEPAESTYKEHIRRRAYPLQELAGFVFAYIGPEPAPLLPRYDLLDREDGVRTLWAFVDHCNWVQSAENACDQAHLAWLHAGTYPDMAGKRPRLDWERTSYGVRALTYVPGLAQPKVSCMMFPSANRFTSARNNDVGNHRADGPRHNILYRVPLDDSRTLNMFLLFTPTADGKLVQHTDGVKPTERGVYDQIADGWWRVDTDDQDRVALEQQGMVADRSEEHLASSDRGLILFRAILNESLQAVAEGRDPFGVIRDPAANRLITFDASMNELAALV
ncbi:MAG TPA: Rieske 2Fe-2S domain-containing protein [Chloroflexota bacterium]